MCSYKRNLRENQERKERKRIQCIVSKKMQKRGIIRVPGSSQGFSQRISEKRVRRLAKAGKKKKMKIGTIMRK